MRFEDFDHEDADIAQSIALMDTDVDLQSITVHEPSTKYSGEIEDVKVYWTIDPEDMSPSIKSFINAYKRGLMKKIKHEESLTGRKSELRKRLEITRPIRDRVIGMNVPPSGGVVVEYFVNKVTDMGTGDKVTYVSSLKSIIQQVIPKYLEPYSDFGDTAIDCVISLISVDARMVTSIYFYGILSKVLYEEGRNIAEEYFA